MKKPFNILLILLALLLLSLGILWFWPSSEPEYNGHPVSWWFDKVGPGRPVAPSNYDTNDRYYLGRDTQDAFRHFGNDSLPFLLARIREQEPSPTRKKILTFVASTFHIPNRQKSPDEERRKALWLLGKLGAPAEQAIPILVDLFRTSKDPDLRGMVLQVFAAVGQRAHGALPLLIQAANDPSEYIRKDVASLLPRVAMNPEEIVPALEKLLLDPSWRVCESAASALSSIDRFPRTAVPRLLPLLTRQDRSGQLTMLPVLYRADSETTFQFFLERTHHQTPNVRANALFILSQFKDRPAPVVSCMIEGLEDKEYVVRSAALYGLPPFSQDNPKVIAALMKAAVTAEGLEKREILRTLERIDPQSSTSFQPGRRR